MKKLLLVAALSLGSLTAFAQETESTDPQSTETATSQEEFTEISNDEVPNAVQEAISGKHEGATLSKAAINAEGVYKLEVTKEDGSTKTLYADAEGNFIDM